MNAIGLMLTSGITLLFIAIAVASGDTESVRNWVVYFMVEACAYGLLIDLGLHVVDRCRIANGLTRLDGSVVDEIL